MKALLFLILLTTTSAYSAELNCNYSVNKISGVNKNLPIDNERKTLTFKVLSIEDGSLLVEESLVNGAEDNVENDEKDSAETDVNEIMVFVVEAATDTDTDAEGVHAELGVHVSYGTTNITSNDAGVDVKKLKANAGQTVESPLPLIADMGPLLKEYKDMVLSELRYQENQLSMTIESPNLTRLETFKKDAADKNNLKVEIKDSTTTANKVKAVIIISPLPSSTANTTDEVKKKQGNS